jgi:hypothetical protein
LVKSRFWDRGGGTLNIVDRGLGSEKKWWC